MSITPVRSDSGSPCKFIFASSASWCISNSIIVAWSCIGFVNALYHSTSGADVIKRLCTLSAQGTFIILATSCLLSCKLSLFSQTLLVTHCGFKIPPHHRATQVLDYTHAANHWNDHVRYVVSCGKTYSKREISSPFILQSIDRPFQPADNINLLSMIFTGLVFFSATQGS